MYTFLTIKNTIEFKLNFLYALKEYKRGFKQKYNNITEI